MPGSLVFLFSELCACSGYSKLPSKFQYSVFEINVCNIPQVLVIPEELGDLPAQLHALHPLPALPPLPLHPDICLARHAGITGPGRARCLIKTIQLFGGAFNFAGGTPDANFDSFVISLLTVFQVGCVDMELSGSFGALFLSRNFSNHCSGY